MNYKQGCLSIFSLISVFFLNSCVTGLWTSAALFYDRHNVYKKMSDYALDARAHHVLFDDLLFKQKEITLDVAVFNGDILLVGSVPSPLLREIATARLKTLKDFRELFIQVAVREQPATTFLKDMWITTKIRSAIIADSAIDPSQFKIITINSIVYIMGDVKPVQAQRVIDKARNTAGVTRVVKLLKYYILQSQDNLTGSLKEN